MKKHYFTLVELLVVIGIIAVLAGMIFGGAALARSSSRATQCKSNQSETMKILQIAMSDNKDFLVSGDSFSDTPGNKAAWTRYLYGEGSDSSGSMKGKKGYIADMAMLRCPSFKYADDNQPLGALGNAERVAALGEAFGMVYSGSVDSAAGFAGFNFGNSRFEKFTGSGTYNVSRNQVILGGCASKDTSPYNEANALLYSGSWNGKLIKAHSDKCNVFFLDGHVDELTEDNLKKKYLPDANAGKLIKFPGSSTGWIDPDK